MISSLLLILTISQVPAEGYSGQVVALDGESTLIRGQTQYRAVPLAGLRPGDELRSGEGAGLALRLANGAAVYVGSGTQLIVRGNSQSPQMELVAGELRVIAAGEVELPVAAADGIVNVTGGATRIMQESNGLRIGVEQGRALVALRGSREVVLGEAQELSVMAGRVTGPRNYSAEGWEIDSASLLGAAADDELRRRTARSSSESGEDAATRSADQADEDMRRPPGVTENQIAAGSIAFSLAGFSASPGQAASAGLFADANQSTNQGQDTTSPGFPPGDPFPGNIHLVTGETRYGLGNVNLNAAESSAIFGAGNDPAYFSIGLGASPNVQVTTDLNTASGASPHAVRIPGFNAYVLKLEQFGTFDSTLDPAGALNNNIGPAGLLGENPTAPTVNNANPLRDTRNAHFNETATFALGEFRLRPDGGPDNGSFELAVRHSDQDRKIIKDPMGNDANDLVTPNPDVGAFDDVADPRFLPAAPTVKVPRQGTFNTAGTRFSELNNLRRAAATTVLADQLHDFARRTGQTRFVIDGKVIDISGYRKP
jgi:hypothetical protein